MSLPIFQRTIVDGQGNVVNGATVEVRRESDNALALIYSDRAGTIIRANPFFTDASGLAQFYVAQGEYRITATIGGDQVTWRWVTLGIPDGAVTTAALANDAVTLAKLQNVSTLTLLGRGSAGSGDVEQLTIGSGLSVVGGALTAVSGGLPAASTAEAQAGVSNTVAITPLRMKQAQIILGTAVNSTSGTAIDFTGIPSWVRRITVMFNGVSTNGSSEVILQLGDSGGVETSGYVGSAITIAGSSGGSGPLSTGFFAGVSGTAATTRHGAIVVNVMNPTQNTWAAQGAIGSGNETRCSVTAGVKVLSGTLDRLRITTVNGTDVFDAGTINISWE